MSAVKFFPVLASDKDWARQFWKQHWGGETMVVHGEVISLHDLAGFYAELVGDRIGLVTYQIRGDSCEVLSLDSLVPNVGVGRGLLDEVRRTAEAQNCRRLFLVTTNDNLDALRFYQKRGFVLSALRPNAVEASRRLKPTIPQIGDYGIPIRDEIELELRLPAPALE